MKLNKHNKFRIIIISVLLLAVVEVLLWQDKQVLSSSDIQKCRENYILYKNTDEGWMNSDFRSGTEKISAELFQSVVGRQKTEEDFSVVIGTVLEQPKEQGTSISPVHIKIDARTVAGNRNVHGTTILRCNLENFFNYQSILVEGNKYLFLLSSGDMVSRNTTWYVMERRGKNYVFSVLENEGMQQWDGFCLNAFLQAIGVER